MNIFVYGLPRTRSSVTISRMKSPDVDVYFEPFVGNQHPSLPGPLYGEKVGSYLGRLPTDNEHIAIKTITNHHFNPVKAIPVFMEWADLRIVTERPLVEIIVSNSLAERSKCWLTPEPDPESLIAVKRQEVFRVMAFHDQHREILREMGARGLSYHTLHYDKPQELDEIYPFSLVEPDVHRPSHIRPMDRLTNLEEVGEFMDEWKRKYHPGH